MPLPVAHGLSGAAVAAALLPRPWLAARRRRVGALLAGAFLANAADFDFLLVFALQSKAWHRGFSHSLVFALAVCVVFSLCALRLGGGLQRVALACGLAYASHALLDWATTNVGGGVELLWPFTDERYGLRRLGLSELPSLLPTPDILLALALEFALFAPPLVGVLLLRRVWRSGAGRAPDSSSCEQPGTGE